MSFPATISHVCRELRQHYSQLIKDRRLHEERLAELSARCSENMMLKFGRIVDLDMLESVGVNRAALELREKLRESETRGAAETRRYDDVDFSGASQQEEEEMFKLQQLVDAQTRELDTLNQEIFQLTHKGGHLAPPQCATSTGDVA
ncbi:PREDICTED: cilia- and flagella-associated protein 44-like [Priapulus caudatus]|uniref:Cilia- and flagella-associated protein 44-like n=1 Tax=Priapulus caudatus TaxID=37621 RepID=A0ABM1EZF5_PRICU|nr:PREDICTED: cilia- and flagella-associated protein 44-like [Priapulus caudatus]